jgi:threonine synthase
MFQEARLVSTVSGKTAGPLDWQLAGQALEIANLPPFDAALIDMSEWSLWRYGAMLPVKRHFSLGEGMTPLVVTEIDGIRFHAKLEYLNPTGSFKDRGMAVLVNHLLGHAVSEVIEDSSGNAGAALAAYCAAAGIQARIFVPANAPEGKKRLIAAFGAEIVEIPGPRAATTEACRQAAQQSVYASHAWSPFFVAGQMSCAWEIWEQMGLPEAVLCPVGQGGLLLGIARGFRALHAAGLIDRLPRLYAVQAAGCDPIVQAWERDLSEPVSLTPQPSVADGIAVTAAVRGREVLAVLRETGGGALRVDDEAVLKAQRQLHQHGLLAEATSAVPVAALAQLHDQFERIVLPLTGNSLKSLTNNPPGKRGVMRASL